MIFTQSVSAQIFINEVCPRNATVLTDDDGEFDDWIEFYNAGNDTISLLNWQLSDNLNNPGKWIFPDVSIYPNGYLVLFADDQSSSLLFDHWETTVHADSIWKYWIPDQNPDSLWNTLAFNDSAWLEGPGGFGRGDGDDNTILPDSVATIYIRKKFEIVDTSLITRVVMHVDFDDAFVAYLNGVEIARKNIGWPGKIENWNNIAYDRRFAQMYLGLPPEEFRIPRELFLQAANEGENVLAVQGLNAWNNDGNSSLIPFLSFAMADSSFSYKPTASWFEHQEIYLHTNFKLAADGEELILSNPDGQVVDQFAYPPMLADHSFGRVPDGGSQKGYILINTPNASNDTVSLFAGYCKTPLFDHAGGFFEEAFPLGIANSQPGDTIRYTLDGSWVNDTAAIWVDELQIDSTLTVRARVFKSGYLPGKTTTATFFMNESISLPVFSININPHDLWDEEEGIYVLGNEYDPNFPHLGANYWQDWEKPVNIEYFDTAKQMCFELEADVVIHGGYSRAYDMKSLRVLTNNKYDQPSIDYQFFPEKEINSFKKIILRNAGQDYLRAQFRDGVIHRIFSTGTNIDYQGFQPSVVFLNGQYWGIHNIREKIDRFYIEENFGYDPDSVQLLRDNIIEVEGNFHHYAQMIDYIKNVPEITDEVYDSIAQLVDIPNYTDYFIAEIHVINPDWPNHNTKYWRLDNDTSRWRYILTDVDYGFGLYSNPTHNELYRVLHNQIQWADNHKILRRLIENENYKRYFINRSADMFNTVLKTDRVLSVIEESIAELEPEIQRHVDRWNGDIDYWQEETQDVWSFAANRLVNNRQHYINEFGLNKLVDVTIDVDSVLYGKVQINTICPEPYPWTGIYFDGNPISLLAMPAQEFVFSHWEVDSMLQGVDTLVNPLEINVDTNATFTAHFIPFVPPEIPRLAFTEINYRSVDTLDTGDWIELKNIDSVSVDISGWMFRDGNENHSFYLPDSLVLDTNEYLVLCQDTALFKVFNPETNIVGQSFEFGLATEGEELFLFSDEGDTVIFMEYQTAAPWPDEADETGKTFEIHDPYGDLSDGNNWFAGCVGGSPGEPFMACDTVDFIQNRNVASSCIVYPNPTKHILIIESSATSQETIAWELYNANGVLKLKGEIQTDNRTEIQLYDLKPGVYFLKIRENEFVGFHKVLIIK